MRRITFVSGLVSVAAGRATASPVATTGTISGTISLATQNAQGPPFVPAGSIVTVRVGILEGDPLAPHLRIIASVQLSAPAPGNPLPFSISGLPFGGQLEIQAEARALNLGPHGWLVGLSRTDAPGDATITLSSRHPNLMTVAFSAKGAAIPADAAAERAPMPLGHIGAFVHMERIGTTPPLDALPAGLMVIACAENDAASTPVGTATIDPRLASYDGGHSANAYFQIADLPLDTPLVLKIVAPPGSDSVISLAAKDRFMRPSPASSQFHLVDGVWHFTLSEKYRNVNLSALFFASRPRPSP